jgi:hypothetical protein
MGNGEIPDTGGDSYNDLFTAVGIYLVALFACRCLIRFSPQRSVKILGQVSKPASLRLYNSVKRQKEKHLNLEKKIVLDLGSTSRIVTFTIRQMDFTPAKAYVIQGYQTDFLWTKTHGIAQVNHG